MTVFSELGVTLRAFDFVQMLLALLFLTGYAAALGELFGPRGRRRAAGLAVAAAGAFVAMTDPWIHGVLLVVVAVAGVGMFIVAAWVLSVLSARAAQHPFAADLAARTHDSLSALSIVPVLEDAVPPPAPSAPTTTGAPLRAPRRVHSI